MNILALSVHPDDETLGCGGTLLKHRAAGDTLHWLVVTAPDPSRYTDAFIRNADAQVKRVANEFGMERVVRCGLPTAQLDTLPQAELMTQLKRGLQEIRPEIVYLIHGGDVHTDHAAVFRAALGVLKPFHMSNLGVKRILSYETLSSTDAAPPQNERAFVPNVFSDITPFVERKIEIMQLYQTEAQPDLYPRGASAIRALARVRGATIGVEYAEAFMLVRELC